MTKKQQQTAKTDDFGCSLDVVKTFGFTNLPRNESLPSGLYSICNCVCRLTTLLWTLPVQRTAITTKHRTVFRNIVQFSLNTIFEKRFLKIFRWRLILHQECACFHLMTRYNFICLPLHEHHPIRRIIFLFRPSVDHFQFRPDYATSQLNYRDWSKTVKNKINKFLNIKKSKQTNTPNPTF